MEDNFDTYLIQVARNCGTNYICVFGEGNCGASFRIEDEIVQHLRSAHGPEFLNRYNLLNGILAAVRPPLMPPTPYNEEASIGRAISEEVAINSEGEGDDPLCISSAEKRKAIDMELMCPTCKRSRYHKNVVEESTAVAYDMKEHVPMKEKRDVLSMIRNEEELDEYGYNMQRKKELEEYAFNMLRKPKVRECSYKRDALSFSGHTLNFIPHSMSRFRLPSSLCLFPGATWNDIPQSMSSLPLLSSLCLFPGATWNDIPQSMSSRSSYECHAYQ